jgi:hypothetical protein
MAIAIIIVVSLALLVLFLGVTIAGGRAHDRQNAELAARKRHCEKPDTDPTP